jgi:hypothetical protein
MIVPKADILVDEIHEDVSGSLTGVKVQIKRSEPIWMIIVLGQPSFI